MRLGQVGLLGLGWGGVEWCRIRSGGVGSGRFGLGQSQGQGQGQGQGQVQGQGQGQGQGQVHRAVKH